jgi:hypothetical protein
MEERRLALREKEDMKTLLDFDRIKKKILQAYRYKITGIDQI